MTITVYQKESRQVTVLCGRCLLTVRPCVQLYTAVKCTVYTVTSTLKSDLRTSNMLKK